MVGAGIVTEGIVDVHIGADAMSKTCRDDVSALMLTSCVPCSFSGLRLKCNPGIRDDTLGSVRADVRFDLSVSCLPSLSVNADS